MLRTPEILGFSMASRKNRRVMVAVNYGLLLPLMAGIILFRPPTYHVPGLKIIMWVAVAFFTVGFAILGKIVDPTTFPLPSPRGGETISLGLAHAPQSQVEPDERDISVRNTAYFQAYRALATYIYVGALLSAGIDAWSFPLAMKTLQLFSVPLLAMALTLPQAIILWSEPDIPEELKL